MTDPVPALATGLPAATAAFDRRSFLATLAAAGVMTPELVEGAQTGPIELAYAEWLCASRQADAANEAVWTLEEAYEAPERPRWHPMRDEGGHKLVVVGERKCRCYLDDSAKNIAHLRQLIDAPESVFTAEGWTPEMFPPRVEAARRTLTAITEWQAEDKRRADACGLTAAREQMELLVGAVRAQRAVVLEDEPASFREAAFQAALLSVDWDEDGLSRLCDALTRLAGIPSYFDETASSAPVAA